MKTIKRLSSDWDIYADTMTIFGNLVVVGKSTSVESIETLIYDNFITLAAGQGGGPNLNAGIEVDRGASLSVGIRWHEEMSAWQYTNDGVLWKTFSRMVVEEDKAPRLGGNLLVQDSDGTSWAITSNHLDNVVIYAGVDNLSTLPPLQKPDGSVVIGPVVRLPQLDEDPYKKTGYSSIYAKQTSTGDTGLFVANEKTVGHELITKRKAFVYSLIF
jgi:hypothetical protein